MDGDYNSFDVGNLSDYSSLEFNWSLFDYPGLELPLRWQGGLIFLYSFTALLTLVGNIVVLIVLARGNRSRTQLSRYLINMGISDLCMAVFCIPFTYTKTMLGRWVFGEVMCPLVLFMQVLSVAVAIYTNTAIGIDRYLAVCYPLRQRVTKTRVYHVIAFIWILSTSLALTQLVVGRSTTQFYAGEHFKTCSEHWPNDSDSSIFTLVLFFLAYLIPLAILSFTYFKIVAVLWRPPDHGCESADRCPNNVLVKRKVTKMLVTLVVVFAVCWLPIHLFNMVIDLHPSVLDRIHTQQDERLYIGIFYICHWLAMSNCFANPVIYCFLSDSFRADLKYLCRRTPCHSCVSSLAQCLCTRKSQLVRQGSHLLVVARHCGAGHPSSSSSSRTPKGKHLPAVLHGEGEPPSLAQSCGVQVGAHRTPARCACIYKIKVDMEAGTV